MPTSRVFSLISRRKDIILFCVIGAVTAVIYFTSIAILHDVLLIDYRIAVSVSYGISIICHFIANRNITFKSKHNISRQVIKYAVMVGINYLMTMVIVILCKTLLSLSVYTSAVLAILFNLFINFLLLKYWVFLAKNDPESLSSTLKQSRVP